MRVFATVLIGLVFAVLALGAAALIALQSVDLARYQGLASDRVEAITGRRLAIDGEMRVAGILRPAIAVQGVRFANAPGAADHDMVRVAELEAELRLVPLLFGELILDRLVIRGARILLEVDETGAANWQFAPTESAAAAPAEPGEGGGFSIPAGIGEIRIADSTLEYRAAGAAPIVIGIASATLGAGGPAAPVTLKANLTWDGAPVTVDARSAPAAALAATFPDFPATVEATAFGATLRADGRVAAGIAEFAFTVEAASLQQIKDRFGIALASDGPFFFAGGISAGADGGQLDDFSLRLGGTDLAGDLVVALGGGLDGSRPRVTGALAANRIALADFAAPAPGQAAPAAPGPTAAAGRLIPAGPLPALPLGAADAQVSLAVAELVLPSLPLADVRLAAHLNGGVLNLALANATLPAGGTLAGTLGLRPEAGGVAVGIDLTGTELALAGLAGRALADAIEGAVDVKLHLEGQGADLAAIAPGLDGRVSLLMGQGRARAAILDDFVGGITTVLSTLGAGDDGWTVVNCAAVAFDITSGIAESQVMLFDSRAATVAGHGTVDLRTEVLDLVVTPEAKVATLSLSTPVLVGGTLANPTFAPDPVAVARRIAGVLGIFVFPPAAIAGLADLGTSGNACVELAAAGEAPAADGEPAAPADGPLPALPGAEDVERALEGLGRGLQNFLGGGP